MSILMLRAFSVHSLSCLCPLRIPINSFSLVVASHRKSKLFQPGIITPVNSKLYL